MNSAAVDCEYFSPHWIHAFMLFGMYLGVSILGHRVTTNFFFF